MPITDKFSLSDIMLAIKYYYKKTKNFITFEYVLLKDVNDSINDAKKLISLLKEFPCKLNVIPYNEIGGIYNRPTKESIEAFLSCFNSVQFIVTVRWSNGTDINAGCGQLAVKDLA